MGKTRHTERDSYDDLRKHSWAGDWMRRHKLGDRLPRGKRFAAGRLMERHGPYGKLWKAVFVDPFPLTDAKREEIERRWEEAKRKETSLN